MKVAFLGTSGALPTAERNASAHVVWVKGETVLLDCGEGTQRQLRRSSHRFAVDRIFLTHMHLDHILGLTGYVWSRALLSGTEPLRVYVPRGSAAYIRGLIGAIERLPYPLHLEELDDGSVVQADGYRVIAGAVEHVEGSLAFRIEEDARPGKVDLKAAKVLGLEPGPRIGQLVRGEPVTVNGRLILPAEVVGPSRPGRSLVYSGDTRPCKGLEDLARGADLLIHESMYLRALTDEARARAHSTSSEAALVALNAGVRRLALTHVSHRHQDAAGIRQMEAEAREIFPEVFLPEDLDACEIPVTG